MDDGKINVIDKTILKPWPNGLACQRKFANPELAYGLAKGSQTDSQVGSQVAKSSKFHTYHWLMRFYNNRLLAINLCRLALGGQTVKNVRLLASKFELDQSRRKWVAKRNASSTQKRMSTSESVWPGLKHRETKTWALELYFCEETSMFSFDFMANIISISSVWTLIAFYSV